MAYFLWLLLFFVFFFFFVVFNLSVLHSGNSILFMNNPNFTTILIYWFYLKNLTEVALACSGIHIVPFSSSFISCYPLMPHELLYVFFGLQFHYAVFFAYIRLREQEIRNLMWISECVAQNQKSRVHDSVVFIF